MYAFKEKKGEMPPPTLRIRMREIPMREIL